MNRTIDIQCHAGDTLVVHIVDDGGDPASNMEIVSSLIRRTKFSVEEPSNSIVESSSFEERTRGEFPTRHSRWGKGKGKGVGERKGEFEGETIGEGEGNGKGEGLDNCRGAAWLPFVTRWYAENFENNPMLAMRPSKWTKVLLRQSCEILDKVVRLDGYTVEEVCAVLAWAVKDDFWGTKGNLRSLANARKLTGSGDTKFSNVRVQWLKSTGRLKGKAREQVRLSLVALPLHAALLKFVPSVTAEQLQDLNKISDEITNVVYGLPLWDREQRCVIVQGNAEYSHLFNNGAVEIGHRYVGWAARFRKPIMLVDEYAACLTEHWSFVSKSSKAFVSTATIGVGSACWQRFIQKLEQRIGYNFRTGKPLS